MISFRIFGVREREENIIITSKQIPSCTVVYDEKHEGCFPTAKRAWTIPTSEEWTCCLTDDVMLCDGFVTICEKMVQTHPDKIISLFPFDYMEESGFANSLATPYVEARIVSGCGIILRTEWIHDLFQYSYYAHNDTLSDDDCIKRFADRFSIPTITTIPATLQHIGDQSIMWTNARVRRTVYFRKNPIADWSCKDVAKRPKEPPRFLFERKCIF